LFFNPFKKCKILKPIFVLPTMNSTAYNSPTLSSRVLSEKLTVPESVKKHPAFYGTRSFITAFTTASHLSPSTARPTQSIPRIQFSNIRFNIILPSMRRSSKWSLSIAFPHQMHHPSPHRYLYVPAISFFLIRSPKQCSVRSNPTRSDCRVNKHTSI
jgi:hypothetical protein